MWFCSFVVFFPTSLETYVALFVSGLSVLIAGHGLKSGSTVDVWKSLSVLDGGGSYAIAFADLLHGELASANAASPAR